MSRSLNAMNLRIDLSDVADDAVRQAIAGPLVRYNEGMAGPGVYRPLVLSLHDEAGTAIGGLWASTGYGWLYTQMLLVPEQLRGQGIGHKLMQQAEDEARRRGCQNAWLDTQFGARPFYEKLGYTAFGHLPDYPPGFARTFLCKAL